MTWLLVLLALVGFMAPAGSVPAGHLHGATYDAVLPSGRIVTPLGTSAVTGVHALGLALAPGGRFAVVTNDDARDGRARSAVDPLVSGGFSLSVIDTATMRVVGRFSAPGETYAGGLAVVRDATRPDRSLVFAAGGPGSVVYVLDLDGAGELTVDERHVIALADQLDPAFFDLARGGPVTLAAAPDGRRLYAVDQVADTVSAIDTGARRVSGTSRSVGFFPFGAAPAGGRLLVANEGLMRYPAVAGAPLAPPFGTPPVNEQQASSLSLVGLAAGGDFAPPDALAPAAVAMDPAPDGRRIVGGAHPTAIAVSPDGAYAFVAMTNVDRIATVALSAAPHVVGGAELRLFDRGPYGTQPAALALSRDGSRLYVALAGLDAVAVLDARDPLHLHRLGLLPAGWFPSALALTADDRTLFVLNTQGFGRDIGIAGDPERSSDAIWSTLQAIDLGSVSLADATLTALKNARTVLPAVPRYPAALRNVVVIVTGAASFDAMLGDLGYGPADPAGLRFGAAITPNLHALARRFGVAGNLFADADSPGAAHQLIAAGTATPYTLRIRAAGDGGADPEDYPRTGSIFDDLARHQIDFRDYGDLLGLSGYDRGAAADPGVDDPAPTRGLGGRYAAGVPAPVVLDGRIDPDYPGPNARIRDERRAREFVRDHAAQVKAHREPRYAQIWLPGGRAAAGPGTFAEAANAADADRALGTIVGYLSGLPSWGRTAVFVVPEDAENGRDHVDGSRTYALVISPFAKPHYIGMRHLSTVSVLKTAEQILNLPPLGLGDLLATDMRDFFTSRSDVRPFALIPVPEPEPSG